MEFIYLMKARIITLQVIVPHTFPQKKKSDHLSYPYKCV